jgi:gamma-glutamylcyclotransferase (GGCT)/AIG2-like uncharacterized protein YtfP
MALLACTTRGSWAIFGKSLRSNARLRIHLPPKASFAMPLLFSYGTLQQEKVQLSTFGRLLQGRRDELPGFEQSSVRIVDPQVVATSGKTHHANVTFNGKNDSRVSGTLFDITDAELAAADQYEQPAAYKRVTAMLASGKQAWVYVDARSAPEAS